MLHIEPLLPENQEALHLYRSVGTQVAVDLHLAPMLLLRMLADRRTEEIIDLMDRFSRIHESMRRIAEAQPKG